MKTKVLSAVTLIILINCEWISCTSDLDNDRSKRTVGVFFRSFLDAFQTQKQPAPNVVSLKPSKPLNPQSIKADIFSSSKPLFLQKQNLLKVSVPSIITQAPKTAAIPTTPPTTLPPKALPEPVNKVSLNQLQPTPAKCPIVPSLEPLTKPSLPIGQKPFIPVKAQILIHPFQGHHGQETPFAEFGLQPHLPSGLSPFNYQAEIYLQPPVDGIHPSAGYPSGRFSPDNGWHDVDEILSKGVQTPSEKGENIEFRNDEYTKLKNTELNQYESNTKLKSDDTKYTENPKSTGSISYSNVEHHENNVEDARREGHFQNYHGSEFHLSSPLFFPHLSYSDFNANSYDNQYGSTEGSSHFDGKSHSFHQLFDEAFKKLAPEGFNVKLEPQSVQDRARVNDVGVVQNRSWSENTDLGTNNTPKKGVDNKLTENSHEQKYDHKSKNDHNHVQSYIHYPEYNHIPYQHFPEPGLAYFPEHEPIHYSQYNLNNHENVHHPESKHALTPNHDSSYDNNNYKKDYFEDVEHQTNNDKLPSHYPGIGDQHHHSPAAFYNLPTYDSSSDYTEISNTHPNGYYHFKRSYTTKRQI